jgi:hypothetical protein
MLDGDMSLVCLCLIVFAYLQHKSDWSLKINCETFDRKLLGIEDEQLLYRILIEIESWVFFTAFGNFI